MAKVVPVVTHRKVTSGTVDSAVEVDLYNWNDTHPVAGLENLDDTADADKPVSTATQASLDAKVTGPSSVIDDLPAIFDGTTGKLIKSKTYAAFKTLLALVKGDVGLGSVDNTSDSAKPVSTAQQTALDLKASISSPTFTGTPAAPTAARWTNTTQLATTAFVTASANSTYNPYNYGAVGDGVTDDATAITSCITAARAAGKTMVLTDGTYAHSSAINWAWSNFKVLALGDRVIFQHTGTGVAHNFNGMTNYPASQGCVNGVFGGPGRIMIYGNANTTNAVLIDNWHWGEMRVGFGGGCTSAFFRCQDTGIVGASAVESVFDINMGGNNTGLFSPTPTYGAYCYGLAACTFLNPTIEYVGNVGSGSPGFVFEACTGNLVQGGTTESCLAGGVNINSTSSRNVFISHHAEVNGTAQDWTISGADNTFIGCAGAGTASGQYLNGDRNFFLGGTWQSMVIVAGASENKFINPKIVTAFTDGGDHTTVLGPDSIFDAQDYATARLGNKSINTANGNAFYVNSKQITDLSGTGSILPTTVSPAFTTPSLGVATATSINGAALNNLAWTSYTPTVTSQGGTLTSASATGLYKQIGKTVIVQVDVTVTNAGTGTLGLLATLPVTAAANVYVGTAYEHLLNGKSGAAVIGNISATQIAGRGADGVTMIATGALVAMTAVYEAA